MSATRKEPIYGNCKILAPDGTLLCRTQRKRADWYTSRGLATVIEDGLHYVIQLNFTPAGNGHEGEPFYLVDKVNQCVCCGKTDELTGHHVVPYCFRKWFADSIKGRDSHDILILCPDCHHDYEHVAWQLKVQLFFEATGSTNQSQLTEEDRAWRDARSNAAALTQTVHRIPLEKMAVLRQRVADYLGHDPTAEELHNLSLPGPKAGKHPYPPGRKVVDKLTDIDAFIRMWRVHFLDTMEPQFLPPFWSVDHRLGLQRELVGL